MDTPETMTTIMLLEDALGRVGARRLAEMATENMQRSQYTRGLDIDGTISHMFLLRWRSGVLPSEDSEEKVRAVARVLGEDEDAMMDKIRKERKERREGVMTLAVARLRIRELEAEVSRLRTENAGLQQSLRDLKELSEFPM